tara:strand:+ start:1392 stop:1643 length:252 start_codon:yes stop_codon:yes gene_type:complete
MANSMSDSLQKAFLGVIALCVSCIAIELIPLSRQAEYWNRCFDNTFKWINEKPNLNSWSKKAKESLAVGVCNGAVYEPKLKTK